jgi:hypothetical protein
MVKSLLARSGKTGIMLALMLTAALSYCFVSENTAQEWLIWSNKCLAQAYDQSADAKLKKLDLQVTEDSFIRLRKTYQNGKQEYFSLQLHLMDDMSYLGNVNTGTILLKTKEDEVIVQTYNDRKGNVDSMANVLVIPVKNMDAERLDSLQQALNYFKGKGL